MQDSRRQNRKGFEDGAVCTHFRCKTTAYKSVSPLTYDEEDRLTGYATDMTAGYSSDGLRAWKQVGTTTTYYIYSGSTPICEVNGTTGAITAVNTFGPTGLLARHTDSGTTFYTFDPQGNVSQTLEADGDIASTQLYDAYGALLSGGSTPPFGFGAQHGYYTDPETGLLLLTHRYYDPEEGRFLTRDPIGYAGGMNLYAYVGGNPVNDADPSGYCESEPYHDLTFDEWLRDIGDDYANKIQPPGYSYGTVIDAGGLIRGLSSLPYRVRHLGVPSATQGVRGVIADTLTALEVGAGAYFTARGGLPKIATEEEALV